MKDSTKDRSKYFKEYYKNKTEDPNWVKEVNERQKIYKKKQSSKLTRQKYDKEYRQSFIGRKNNKLITTYIAHLKHHPDPAVLACYLFSSMASLGWLEGLNRCQSPECLKFFIGRSNVKWCSKTCGSRSRVKKMRKKNRSNY